MTTRENGATTFLMYHELRCAGRTLASSDPGYVRYVVDENAFLQQMDHLVSSRTRGLSVSEWIDGVAQRESCVVLTFDDGCETDLISAAPILLERGFSATFYLTVDFLGRPGFLSHAQARELAASGLEVGCHSMSHAYLSDIDDDGLGREIVEAKDQLEQICGTRIRSLSCPGGRYDNRVLPLARRSGYDSVTTSRCEQNTRVHPPGLLGRFAIMQDTDLGRFDGVASGREISGGRVRDSLLATAKSVLGNSLYEKLRSGLLRLRSHDA